MALFFFNDTATTEIYTLSLHDALPICHRDRRCKQLDYDRRRGPLSPLRGRGSSDQQDLRPRSGERDRKSTRLNSSHQIISYAVFCLNKKNYYTRLPLLYSTPLHV